MTLNRRQFTAGLAAITAATVGAGALGREARATVVTPAAASDHAVAIDAGLTYFQERAAEQLILAEELVVAIQAGDLEAAKTAYIASRPPYEEIEVLAASFPETDEALDARPYAFPAGELSDDFRGFHRIEALLFRDSNLAAAEPYAEQMIVDVRTLAEDLTRRDNFTPRLHFEGMIALATEVASKKISSEEETWSDQSLLIFRDNWRGILSQYEPFAPAVETESSTVAVEVTAAGEAAQALLIPYLPADGIAAAPYSSVPLADRGEIASASYRLRDALMAARDALAIG